MEKMNDLKDLFKHEIEDLYSVEEQILNALPKMIDKAKSTELKNALSEHLRITQTQKERLDEIQQMLKGEEEEEKKSFLAGIFSGKQTCKGMQGIIEEGNKIMNADMSPEVLDAVIIACAQKVEHYEICGYGTARTYSKELGLRKITGLLEQTLDEEYQADDKLTQLAIGKINVKAEDGSSRAGDRSASESTGRSGRSSKPKVREAEMEQVNGSSTRSTSAPKKNASSDKSNGKPKASSSPGSTAARTTAATKKVPAKRSSKTSSGSPNKTSSRTGSTGRSSGSRTSGRR